MDAIIVLVTFYILLWPLYFRICTYSLLAYSITYNISQDQLKTFMDQVDFPFNMLNLRLYQNSSLIGIGVINLINKLDELKKQNDELKKQNSVNDDVRHIIVDGRIIYSVIPMIVLFMSGIGLFFSRSSSSFIVLIILILANGFTLATAWKFGNKLSEVK